MPGSSFVPLGHMLTHKIAYQIATGLAYLHKKNIIFCDLKSDNILVWSLDVREHVNIKLSDYGISRQSFHEGALGVEGTPGYQAPEIRPRIVYDEKVTWRGLCGAALGWPCGAAIISWLNSLTCAGFPTVAFLARLCTHQQNLALIFPLFLAVGGHVLLWDGPV